LERFRINCVVWFSADLPFLNTRFTDDEQDRRVILLRCLGRRNAVYLPFLRRIIRRIRRMPRSTSSCDSLSDR
jgi:hypothetical protein